MRVLAMRVSVQEMCLRFCALISGVRERLHTQRSCSRCTLSHLREAVGVRLGKVVLAHASESELRINENQGVKHEEPSTKQTFDEKFVRSTGIPFSEYEAQFVHPLFENQFHSSIKFREAQNCLQSPILVLVQKRQ